MNLDILFDNFGMLSDAPKGVSKLREMILQMAVQGKLVPQDSNDEPASALLEKIKAEKERLIKEKKIKKTKPLPPITPDEIPYALPDGWEWARVRDITYDLGQEKPKSRFTYIDVSSIDNKVGIISDNINIIEPEDAPSRARKFVSEGSVIYSTVRPYLLNIAVVNDEYIPKPIVSTAFAVLHPFEGIIDRFIFYYLRSKPFIKFVESQMSGMAYPAISDTKLNRGIIPVPPSNEQKRIVTKVDQLMAICDELETNLSKSQTDCDGLLNAIVSNIENGSVRKSQIVKNRKTDNIKIEEKKTSKIEKQANTPENKGTSTSKSQRNIKKSEKKFDKSKVLIAFRKAIFRQNGIDELSLLRISAQHLGIKRLSQPIRHELESYINTAIRRKILYRDEDGYSAGAPTIEHYEDDFLIKVIRSIIKKGYEYQRERLVEDSANYLGFDKVSDAFKERMKSVFRKAIRQRDLYRNGLYIGKV